MSDPKPASPFLVPAVKELDPGTYFWCSCGHSKGQPFCDGSHAGSSFRPMKVEITEKKKVALCQCKITGHAPMCDGSHKSLQAQKA
jgi:CDGSH-type Zn-finger protein